MFHFICATYVIHIFLDVKIAMVSDNQLAAIFSSVFQDIMFAEYDGQSQWIQERKQNIFTCLVLEFAINLAGNDIAKHWANQCHAQFTSQD